VFIMSISGETRIPVWTWIPSLVCENDGVKRLFTSDEALCIAEGFVWPVIIVLWLLCACGRLGHIALNTPRYKLAWSTLLTYRLTFSSLAALFTVIAALDARRSLMLSKERVFRVRIWPWDTFIIMELMIALCWGLSMVLLAVEYRHHCSCGPVLPAWWATTFVLSLLCSNLMLMQHEFVSGTVLAELLAAPICSIMLLLSRPCEEDFVGYTDVDIDCAGSEDGGVVRAESGVVANWASTPSPISIGPSSALFGQAKKPSAVDPLYAGNNAGKEECGEQTWSQPHRMSQTYFYGAEDSGLGPVLQEMKRSRANSEAYRASGATGDEVLQSK